MHPPRTLNVWQRFRPWRPVCVGRWWQWRWLSQAERRLAYANGKAKPRYEYRAIVTPEPTKQEVNEWLDNQW